MEKKVEESRWILDSGAHRTGGSGVMRLCPALERTAEIRGATLHIVWGTGIEDVKLARESRDLTKTTSVSSLNIVIALKNRHAHRPDLYREFRRYEQAHPCLERETAAKSSSEQILHKLYTLELTNCNHPILYYALIYLCKGILCAPGQHFTSNL